MNIWKKIVSGSKALAVLLLLPLTIYITNILLIRQLSLSNGELAIVDFLLLLIFLALALFLSVFLSVGRLSKEVIGLRQAIETSGEVVFMTDSAGIIQYVNPEFTRVYGYSAAEVIGKTTPRILKGGQKRPEDYQQFWQTILSKRAMKWEIINKTKDGRLINIEATVNRILDGAGQISGFLAIQRDITRRKQMEQEIQTNYKKLVALEGLKDNLMHMIVHDLNNPLTVVLAGIDYLKGTLKNKMSENDQAISKQVSLASRNMMVMVGNILDINKMEEGKFVLRVEEVDLRQAVIEAYEQMKIYVESEKKALRLELAEDMPKAWIDKDVTMRVLYNFINNAIKYTPQGGIIVVKAHYDQADNNFYLAVKDEGKGISAEYLEKIFEKYVQVDGKEANRGRGLG
ncbi:MAG: PAS domain S-box protein, partial [Candidatus Margulisiibacteriota bacterium]